MKRIILLFIVASCEAYSNDTTEARYNCQEYNLVSIIGGKSAINIPRKFQATVNGKVVRLEGDNGPFKFFNIINDNIINLETDYINVKYGRIEHFLLDETHFKFIKSNELDDLIFGSVEESRIILSQGRCIRV